MLNLTDYYKRSFSAFCQDILGQMVADFYKEIINHLEVQQFKKESKTNLAILVSRGHGKAQPLDSCVLTPSGFVQIKNLKIGSKIYNKAGEVCEVVYLHPLEYSDLYEIKTRDGRRTVCTKEHTWKLERYHGPLALYETKDLFTKLYSSRLDKRTNKPYKEFNYYLPTITPIDFKQAWLPIDPYLLGVWLGDGCSNSGQIVSNDPEIFNYVNLKSYKQKTKFMYNVVGLNKLLRQNKLKNNKHIPESYLISSLQQRLELLRGLMDTDGYIQKDGRVYEFSNKNKILIKGFIYLVRSLGGTCSHSIKKIKINDKINEYQRVSFRLPSHINPFKLSRKRDKFIGSIKTKSAITDVNYIGKGWARCIATSSRDGSYITDDFMPTQNTITFSKAFPIWTIYRATKPVTIIIESMNQDMARRILALTRDELTSNINLNHFIFKKETDKLLEIYMPGFEGDALMTHKIYSVPVGTRGLHGDIVISDDVQKDDEGNSISSMKKLKSTWWNSTYPMSHAKNGLHLFIGTPISHNDMFYDIREIKQKGGNWDILEYPALSYNEDGVPVPLFPQLFSLEKLMKIKESTPDWTWQQEYMLIPIGQDAMFPLELINSAVDLEYEPLSDADKKNVVNYMGCDIAFSSSSKADFSAFCVISKAPNRPMRIEHIWHERGVDEPDQINEIKNIKRVFNVSSGLIEQKGVSHSMANKVVSEVELAGVMDLWNPTNEEKQKILGNLYLLMKHKMLCIPSDLKHSELFIQELMSFGIVNDNGNQKYRAMSGHDDLVIGVALAVAAAGGWVFEEVPQYRIELI